MVALGHRSYNASVNSNSAVQNVEGPLARVVTLKDAMPIVFACNPGDDILTKISLDCEIHNRAVVAIISMNGIVMNPRLICEDNKLQMYKGAHTLLSMTMMNYPFGNNGGSATIAIVGADRTPYGGTVAGPLIAASQIRGVLLVNPLIEDSDNEEDTNSVSDSNEDSDSGSCLTSE